MRTKGKSGKFKEDYERGKDFTITKKRNGEQLKQNRIE